jgi:hypothetical protein
MDAKFKKIKFTKGNSLMDGGKVKEKNTHSRVMKKAYLTNI